MRMLNALVLLQPCNEYEDATQQTPNPWTVVLRGRRDSYLVFTEGFHVFESI